MHGCHTKSIFNEKIRRNVSDNISYFNLLTPIVQHLFEIDTPFCIRFVFFLSSSLSLFKCTRFLSHVQLKLVPMPERARPLPYHSNLDISISSFHHTHFGFMFIFTSSFKLYFVILPHTLTVSSIPFEKKMFFNLWLGACIFLLSPMMII